MLVRRLPRDALPSYALSWVRPHHNLLHTLTYPNCESSGGPGLGSVLLDHARTQHTEANQKWQSLQKGRWLGESIPVAKD